VPLLIAASLIGQSGSSAFACAFSFQRSLRHHLRPIEIRDIYTCPARKTLTTTGYIHTDDALPYLGSGPECRACPLKAKCCPNMPARRIVRDVNEAARDVARALAKTQAFAQSRRDRKKRQSHPRRALREHGVRFVASELPMHQSSRPVWGWRETLASKNHPPSPHAPQVRLL
jgi:hypothetical protein